MGLFTSMEAHTTSLSLSKRLKELGVKQESQFYWDKEGELFQPMKFIEDNQYIECSAFLSSELGELLPDLVGYRLRASTRHFKKWEVYYEGKHHPYVDSDYPTFRATTECEARGLMLEYLINNKIITL